MSNTTLEYNYDLDPTYNAALITHFVLSTFIVVFFHLYYGLPALRWGCERVTTVAYLILIFTYIGAGGDYGLVYLQEYRCGQLVSAISTSVAFFVMAWLPRWYFGCQLCGILDRMMVRFSDRSIADRVFYIVTWAGPCFMMLLSSIQVCLDVINAKFGGFANVVATCMQTGATTRDHIPVSDLSVLIAILGPAILVPFQFWMFSRTVQALRHDRERQRTIRIARFCFTITFVCNLLSSAFTVFVTNAPGVVSFAMLSTYIGSLLGVVLPLAIQKSTFWEYIAVGKAFTRSAAQMESTQKDTMSVSLNSTTRLPVKTAEHLENSSNKQITLAAVQSERTLFN